MEKRQNKLHPIVMKNVRLFLLWLIKKKEMHGYEIMKTLKEDGMRPIGSSRIYPLLKCMMQEGLISQIEKNQGKRVKKIYVLTKRGKNELMAGKRMFKGLVREFVEEMLQ
ncbi:MAG: PadR family transcriptional regulator [Candidatus Micrarchaeota archaeon]|nr:PadR family transcriptional regulator [Candidatus Micrarchaeota archaeon]